MPIIETNFGPVVGQINMQVQDIAGVTPTNIVRLSDGFRLIVDWQLNGLLVGMLSGQWQLVAYLESIGPQAEVIPPIVNQAVLFTDITGPASPFLLNYHKVFDIPPNTPNQPGVYKLVAVLTCKTPAGTPGPFAGFAEGPLMQFYVAP